VPLIRRPNWGYFFLIFLFSNEISWKKDYKRLSFPRPIRKEKEEVGNLINEKWVGSPILDSNQTETVLKYIQKVGK
jgi:hypothetical protein